MLNVLFPKLCIGCSAKLLNSEKLLCSFCRHSLPIASFHRSGDQAMKNLFYGRIPIHHATALLYFHKKGITQKLMHELKYRNRPQISEMFGKWLGDELVQAPEYLDIEMVIPVPLHKNRLRKRGYNQVDGFGREIAASLKIPFRTDLLLKVTATNSQVFKKRWSRFENDAEFIVTEKSAIQNKHILLVDDIVTTGATLEKCATILMEGTNIKLSLATIAIA